MKQYATIYRTRGPEATSRRRRPFFAGLLGVLAGLGAGLTTGAVETTGLPVSLRVTGLRCEGLGASPVVDAARPRLSWQMEGDERGRRQTAYRLLVARTPEALAEDRGDLFDSGKVLSDRSQFVPYEGTPLGSRLRCHWKVRVWDEHDRASAWSPVAAWTMGLLNEADWRGRWIASDLSLMEYQRYLQALDDFAMERETGGIYLFIPLYRAMMRSVHEAPAVWLRKEFESPRVVRRATLTVSGLGMHEVYLNGRRVGDHRLDPAFTDYEKRVLYVTHDVTGLVARGRNAVGVVLGNGWFNLITPHLLKYSAADYIAPPRLRLDLELEFADGTREIVGSDESWKATTDGPLRFNCVLGGETYDARREMNRWSEPGFDDAAWKPARAAEAPRGRLAAQVHPPIRELARLPAISVVPHGKGWRFDLGVETAGWARLRVRGRPGQSITVRYPGSDSHTFGRYQTCIYVCRGDGEEVFEPRFSYNGFRYVDVEGLAEKPELTDIEGVQVTTDLEPVGDFSCSNEQLNRLQEILLRTLRNYVTHIPNDPTREKAGWTQDVQAVLPEMAWNFNAAAIFGKWQRDFLDAQHKDGYMPPVAPGRFDGPTINGPWWGGAIIYQPWLLSRFYGDMGILAESYPAMRQYFDFLRREAREDLLARTYNPVSAPFANLAAGEPADDIVEWGLGDWLDVGGGGRPKHTPVALTSTLAYGWFARILAETARELGDAPAANHYREEAERIRAAVNRRFLDPKTGTYAIGSQTSQLLPLVLGFVPEELRALVIARFVDQIARDNHHLTTGFVGTPWLLTGLTEAGQGELAYRIATQPDYPGFIDAVLNRGNTVMKEDWKGGRVQMPSLQGPIGSWFYQSLAGIRPDPAAPGFKRFSIRPELAGDLAWVKAHHDSGHGRIAVWWRRAPSAFEMEVTVPPNTQARIHVPASGEADVREGERPAASAPGVTLHSTSATERVFVVGSGHYRFVVRNLQQDTKSKPE
jgi:alpha-L-rhamnosidase